MPGMTAPVYGMGVSGMSLSDYLALGGQASAESRRGQRCSCW